MCGRFTLKTNMAAWLDRCFEEPVRDVPAQISPRYNIAPTMPLWVVARGSDAGLHALQMKWGLVPPWAKEAGIGSSMINARSESILEKPSFRKPIQTHRCVIAADGYFEWKTLGPKQKQPYWVHRAQEQPFVFAGIWEQNRQLGESGPLLTAAIMTAAAEGEMLELHHRVPVILTQVEQIAAWLDGQPIDQPRIDELVDSARDEVFHLRAIGRAVGNVANQGPELLEPAESHS